MTRSRILAVFLVWALVGACLHAASQERTASQNPSSAGNEPLVELGREVFRTYGCAECHRREGIGSEKGPDLDKLAEKVDPTYVRESILAPKVKIVPGYGDLQMPVNYGQVLTERQIDALQFYLSNRLPSPQSR